MRGGRRTCPWAAAPLLLLVASAAGAGRPALIQGLAWSPDGTRLACSVRCGGPERGSHIWILDLGARVDLTVAPARQITAGEQNDTDPAWSPDGSSLAFSSSRAGDPELFRVPAEGGDPVRLTREPGEERSPSFTPEGRAIVFAWVHGRSSAIQVMDTAGMNWGQISDGLASDSSPRVSPDGRRIAASSTRGGVDSLLIMNLPGTGRRLLCPGTSPSWMPDSKRLVYVHDQGIWEVSIEGAARPRRLCAGLSAAAGPRDGSIAVLRARGAGTSLHLLGPAGEVEVQVPEVCAADR